MTGAVIECRALVKSFEGVRALNGVSLTFEPGRIKALIGPNGAGKTTLFHLIAGSLQRDAGEILCGPTRIDGQPMWRIARRGIGRLFQDVRVFGRLSVLDNVCVAFAGQQGENPLFPLLRRGRVAQQEGVYTERARALLGSVGLAGVEDAVAEALSYGQQKLLAIARLLAAGSTTLLLDEPTAGVSPALIPRLKSLIRRLAQEGRTLVVIEHNMNVVAEVADWVYFLDQGEIVAFGLPREVLDDRSVRATYLGL